MTARVDATLPHMLADTIKERIKTAMRQGHTLERDLLRVALGELQTVAARTGKDLDDTESQQIVRKLIKSNRETLDAASDAAVQQKLRDEIAILESLLPRTLDVDQIIAALEPVADQVRAANNDGQATGVAMKHLKSAGAAVEGKDVAAAVKQLRA